MTTLLSWYSGDGESRRCDSKCHFAQGPECDCVCGGAYHGAGLEEGELEKRVEAVGDKVLELAQRDFPGTIVGTGEKEDDEDNLFSVKKTRSLWEIPAKRAKRW